ncbi:MAG: hypothetical protein GXZ18_04615 [Synergistaceae bacterium]|nr:hypothetical protein [Synergistaceae bacterium]
MYYKECRHESEKPHSKLLIISFFLVFAFAVCLGSLRLYGLYIEHRISETIGSIEACQENNLKLSQKNSEMLAPAKIYSYAREELGMTIAENIKTVQVDYEAVRVAKSESITVQAEEGVMARLNPFVKSAHAKN